MSNIIINPTTDAQVIALGERVQEISRAKGIWYEQVSRVLENPANSKARAYIIATQGLAINGFKPDVIRAAIKEIVAENGGPKA